MKAMSLHQPWASMIAHGEKTIETRKWRTRYRGDLLICSTKKIYGIQTHTLPYGMALAVVNLWDCQLMVADDSGPARVSFYRNPGLWSWFLKDIRPIKPFPVVGRQGFYEVEYEKR